MELSTLVVQAVLPTQKILSLGVVDGRNIGKANYGKVLPKIRSALATLPTKRIWLAPSCSLIYSPISLDKETKFCL